MQQPAGVGVPGVDGVQPLLEDPAEARRAGETTMPVGAVWW